MRELTVGDFLKENFRIDFSLEQSYYDCDFEKSLKSCKIKVLIQKIL